MSPKTGRDASPPQAVLIDLDGVLYEGDHAIPGAREAIAWLTEARVPHRFLTNTTSRPRTELVDKLDGLGFTLDANAIVTPPVAAARWLRERDLRRVALFVPEATRAAFTDFEPVTREAGGDAVVVGDLGEAWTFAVLNRAFRLLMAEPAPALVALGMTRYWQAEDGLRLDTAPFVVALAHASGVEPVVLGKPAAAFFDIALQGLAVSPSDALMVGDDIRTDVGGAQACGLRGIQVRTGKFQPQDLEGDVSPYAVLDSIADLPAWWRASFGATR